MIANATHVDTKVETVEHEVTIIRDDRRYRVRGLARNISYDQLKINTHSRLRPTRMSLWLPQFTSAAIG
jgi:hypothetical protein